MLQYVAPYQTVCNYANYFLTGLSSHMSEDVKGGTIERILVRMDQTLMAAGQVRRQRQLTPGGRPLEREPEDDEGPHGQLLPGDPRPAVRAGDRRPGQRRLPDRPDGLPRRARSRGRTRLRPAATRPRRTKNFNPESPRYLTDGFYQNQAGGSHNVVAPNTPGDAGSTYTGVPNLRSVP